MGMYCGMYWHVLCFCVGMYLNVCADIARFTVLVQIRTHGMCSGMYWHVFVYVYACMCQNKHAIALFHSTPRLMGSLSQPHALGRGSRGKYGPREAAGRRVGGDGPGLHRRPEPDSPRTLVFGGSLAHGTESVQGSLWTPQGARSRWGPLCIVSRGKGAVRTGTRP